MVSKTNKNIKLSTCKILLCLPLVLLTSNAVAMKVKECDKMEDEVEQTKGSELQEIIKNILITELGISKELGNQIDAKKLPCESIEYRYFTNPKETIYSNEAHFALGATSEIKNSNPYEEQELFIANYGKFIIARHLIYDSNFNMQQKIKIIDTKNGNKIGEFGNIRNWEVIGKNKNIVKLKFPGRNEQRRRIHRFLDIETGLIAEKLERLI